MQQKSFLVKGMTAAVRTIQASPMAPILELTKEANLDEMRAVVEYMNEAIHEAEEAKRKAEDEFLAKKMLEFKASLGHGWVSFPTDNTSAWDEQKAWNELTDAQREQAEKLNLTKDDMDARTFAILTKWIRE